MKLPEKCNIYLFILQDCEAGGTKAERLPMHGKDRCDLLLFP